MIKRFLYLLIICSAAISAGAQVIDEESKLKAAFVYNFTKYIDWDVPNMDEFTIGVLGSSSIYNSLIEIARTKTVNDKRIVIRHFNKPEEIINCNILFISANTTHTPEPVLSKVGKGTLTVSEESGFAEQGTAFNFFVKNDKLKFEANVKSINAAGLKASSQLLKLAIIVD